MPDPSFGNTRVHGILKHICERAGDDLDIPAEKQMNRGSETGVHRDVRYIYPARSAPAIVTEGVLLEMGRRGGDLPRAPRAMRSMIALYAAETGAAPSDAYDEFASFDIDVLAPERTLVEELALLHRLSLEDDGRALVRNGRHLYDVHKLLSHGPILEQLRADTDTVARLAIDADAQSERWKLPFSPRPTQGYALSPAFEPGSQAARSLREGLGAAESLIYGVAPTFEECIATVQAAKDVL